jgi:hypothetical protein
LIADILTTLAYTMCLASFMWGGECIRQIEYRWRTVQFARGLQFHTVYVELSGSLLSIF